MQMYKTENLTTQSPMGWILQALISQNLLLIRVCKHFNLPSRPPPTRGSGKERLIGQRRIWTCLEIVLWSKSIISSLHKNQQQQVHPEETERLCCMWFGRSSLGRFQSPIARIPAVQFSSQDSKHELAAMALPSRNSQTSAESAGLTRTGWDAKQSSLSCLSQQSEDQ